MLTLEIQRKGHKYSFFPEFHFCFDKSANAIFPKVISQLSNKNMHGVNITHQVNIANNTVQLQPVTLGKPLLIIKPAQCGLKALVS